jgi:hypothetical protein
MVDHVKLGPGGIREIEFIAQVFQLIRGGRDPALQIRPTLSVLKLLVERKLLPAESESELREAYVFLRRLEHRLQYVEDKQTHMLPVDADGAGGDCPQHGLPRLAGDARRARRPPQQGQQAFSNRFFPTPNPASTR